MLRLAGIPFGGLGLLTQNTELPRHSPGSAQLLEMCQKKEVWTLLSTLWASDWVVHRPDWPGLLMFSGVRSVCKGQNAVRVPPRAQHDPSSEGVLL